MCSVQGPTEEVKFLKVASVLGVPEKSSIFEVPDGVLDVTGSVLENPDESPVYS